MIKKKWLQLNMKEQIKISTMLRDRYINFVIKNNRKPSKDERRVIVADVYLETREMKIEISDNEIYKYFESKLCKYDKSIEKMNCYEI